MAKQTIWVHTIVHNEENFIWFSLMSVVDYVDKILVWDTGSTDNTVDIIKEVKKIKGEKIVFKEVGPVDDLEFSKIRQAMLEQSDCDWILILDGDEIWWENSIKKITREIKVKNTKVDGIVVPMIVPVGDIYHFQEEKAGRYVIHGRSGHLSLKAISRRISGLHVDKPYGQEGYFDHDNKLVQEREKVTFIEAPFLHVTHLKRSSQVRKYNKFKYELGNKVSSNFSFPEVLYSPYPKGVKSPWDKISGIDYFKARALTPLRKVKRRFL